MVKSNKVNSVSRLGAMLQKLAKSKKNLKKVVKSQKFEVNLLSFNANNIFFE